MIELLKPCPCGKVPTKLGVSEGSTFRWGYVSGCCCGWEIEFRTNLYKIDSPECYMKAVDAWNEAPRVNVPEVIDD